MSIIEALGRPLRGWSGAPGRRFSWCLPAFAIVVFFPTLAAAQDVMTVGSSLEPLQPGQLVVVPVYVRDASGTALGIDAGAGRKIQDLSITVQYSPATAVTAIDVGQAGLTAALTPAFEDDVASGHRRTWIAAFNETTAPLPFNLDASLPGDQVAELNILLSAGVGPTTILVLDLVSSGTALGNRGGTLAETEATGQLRLVGGALGGVPDIFSDGFESGTTGAWSKTVP